MTTRGQGTPDAVHRLSYKSLSFCYDLRDTVRVKLSFPHDITLHVNWRPRQDSCRTLCCRNCFQLSWGLFFFFSQALQNVLWERKWAQWEGIGIINQQHKNAPFPLLAGDRTTPGRSLYPKQTQQMPPGLHQSCGNTRKIQFVLLFLHQLPTGREPGCAALPAHVSWQVGETGWAKQTSGVTVSPEWGKIGLCSKWMNANCPRASLLIQLWWCGRRKSYGTNCSSAKRTLGPSSLYTYSVCISVNRKPHQTHTPHLSCLP